MAVCVTVLRYKPHLLGVLPIKMHILKTIVKLPVVMLKLGKYYSPAIKISIFMKLL